MTTRKPKVKIRTVVKGGSLKKAMAIGKAVGKAAAKAMKP